MATTDEIADVKRERVGDDDRFHSVYAPGQASNQSAFWVVVEHYAGSEVAWFPHKEQAEEFAMEQDVAAKRANLMHMILEALSEAIYPPIPLADLEQGAECLCRTLRARKMVVVSLPSETGD